MTEANKLPCPHCEAEISRDDELYQFCGEFVAEVPTELVNVREALVGAVKTTVKNSIVEGGRDSGETRVILLDMKLLV